MNQHSEHVPENTNNSRYLEKSNGIKLQVNFQNIQLSDDDDSNSEPTPYENPYIQKSTSNLNRDAKLKWQSNILNKKRDVNQIDNYIMGMGGNAFRANQYKNSHNNKYINNHLNNNFASSGNDNEYLKFNANCQSQFLTQHEIKGRQEISNLNNKDICNVS